MSEFVKSGSIYVPSSQAKQAISVTFWHSQKENRILNGLPEEYPIPPFMQLRGYNKVVCRSAHEVEIWSQKLRDQERRDEEMTDVKREMIEGPMRQAARAELLRLASNARNQLNRDFCLFAIQQIDAKTAQMKVKRESFQHMEGYETGHSNDPNVQQSKSPVFGQVEDVGFPDE
jgi:hypothetical protein